MGIRKSLGYVLNGEYVKSDTIDKDVKQPKENSHHREHVRQTMRRDYARDLIQPRDPQFVEAFPDKAKRMGLVPEGE